MVYMFRPKKAIISVYIKMYIEVKYIIVMSVSLVCDLTFTWFVCNFIYCIQNISLKYVFTM